MDIKSNNRQTGAGIASTSASTGASDNTSQNINTGLNSFSYADFVLLSSTISYAIAEEVSVEDLEILVTFLGMISADRSSSTTYKKRSISCKSSCTKY